MKIRLRKRTAVEKAQDKAKKEEKKKLREEKRKIKKDARKNKKDTRKDARDKKKDIRKSDITGKDKRDAKKDVRKDKRDKIKDIKSDKKDSVKEVKEEIKEVRQSLEIILPAKTANVALLREDLRDIEFLDGSEIRALTIEDVYPILYEAYYEAYYQAIVLAGRAYDYLRPFVNLSDRASWIDNWNDDTLLVAWFGEIDDVNNASDVHNRLKSVLDRLNKKITIRVHPQRDFTTSAQNNGTFFEPKTFKVFPSFIKNGIDDPTGVVSYDGMAAVMIHELMHVWFTDQKLENGTKVYGSTNAQTLAKRNPKKARRSAENYEHFCKSFA